MSGAVLGGIALLTLASIPGRAQDFSEAKTALVDYSKADLEPGKGCETLGKFKSKDIVQISRSRGSGRR